MLRSMNSLTTSSTSRRDFLKTTAVLSGVVAAPALLRNSALAQDKSGTLKIGLIGCGGRGSGAADNALRADKDVALTAIGDVFEEPMNRCLQNLKKQHAEKVRVTPETTFVGLDAFQKVINSGVDVVLLATPPGFRPQHLKAAVAAGKHVFCEKPVATDSAGVRSVLKSVKAAKEKNLVLVSGFCWRYDLARREFYKRIHEGAIGDIRAIYATYYTGPVKPMPPVSERPKEMGDVEWQLRNWYNFSWLSGDGYVEQACHSVDKVAWAMRDQPPIKAVAVGGRGVPNNEGNIFDHMFVVYEYADDVRAFVGQRQVANCFSENADYLMGASGVAKIPGWQAPVIKARERWRYDGPKSDMYQNEHDEMFASIRSGKHINNGEWMTSSTLMGIMGRMAAYTGKEVTWEQALNSEEKLVPENLTWESKLTTPPLASPGTTQLV